VSRSGATRTAAAAVLAGLLIGPGIASYLDGPPPAHTGGFGEPSCYGCHFDNDLDAAPGTLTLGGLPEAYQAGGRYRLTLTLTRPETQSAGFQLATRFANGPNRGEQAGALRPLDDRSTVRRDPDSSLEYAQHVEAGTAVDEAGTAVWHLEWTAPDAVVPVAVHASANASNGDRSEFGDFVYQLEQLAAAVR